DSRLAVVFKALPPRFLASAVIKTHRQQACSTTGTALSPSYWICNSTRLRIWGSGVRISSGAPVFRVALVARFAKRVWLSRSLFDRLDVRFAPESGQTPVHLARSALCQKRL